MAQRLNQQLQEAAAVRKSWKYRLKRLVKPSGNVAAYKDRRNGLKLPPADHYDFSHLPIEERLLYEDFFLFSLPTYLCTFDRASMFNHIEVRMPFMDYRLVEFSFSIPPESKLGKGYTKRILRDSMEGIVPQEILKRTYKVGISAPFQHWLNKYIGNWALGHMKTKNFELACEAQGIDAEKLKNAIKHNTLDNAQANQIWKGLNFTLLEP
jgi:asparagine synthase (glutamine-hydrolysing)